MTLLKDNNYKDINVALLSLEADIKNKISGFDTSVIDKQLAEINSRIDKINAGGNNTSAVINDIRYEIEDINSKLKGNSAKIKNIEQKLSDIFSAESKVTDFNTTADSGIYYWVTDAANRPSDYGVLLVNKYNGGDSTSSLWINQIAYGTNSKIYFRQNINSSNWTEWKAVAFEGSMKASFLDEYPGAGGTRLTSGNIVPKDASEWGGMRKDVVTSSMTEGGRPGMDGHLLTMFWDSDGRWDNQLFISNDLVVPPTLKLRQKLNGTDYGSWIDVITSNNIGSQTVASAGTATSVEDGNNVVQYKATSFNGYKMQDTQEKALYVEGRELDSGDSGGIAITNDGVTAFGAGDTDGVFRVINEDNVSAGPVFKVMKDGQVYTTNTIHGSIDGNASTAGTADSARNMYYQNLDLSSLDKTKFYPAFCYSRDDFAEVAIHSPNLSGNAEYNQNRIHFDISTQGWDDLPPTLNIREYACYQNNEVTIGCIGRGIHKGAWAIWLRGGLSYTCFTRNCDLSLKTSDYTFGDETYTVGTNYYGGSNTNVEVWFTPQSTITSGAYSSREITATEITANNRMRIPIGAPSSLEDGCIWIER